MDVQNKIRLHPRAREFLFENYANLRRIFSDVLGHLDISYISITLINKEREVFFLSSSPSIEQNLIEKKLWEYDSIYEDNFIEQDEHKLWSELYHVDDKVLLKKYKLYNQQLIEGLSIPIDYENYRVILSFGFKKENHIVKIKYNNPENLIAVGRYCLNKIRKVILFPDRKKCNERPKLELIINTLSES